MKSVIKYFIEKINQICKETNIKQNEISQITLSVSGFNNTPQELIESFKSEGLNCQIYALHDSLATISLLKTSAKATIIAGTGNAATVLYEGKQRVLGAYGHELSENGCGFTAVRSYILRCLNGADFLESEYKIEEYQQFYKLFADFLQISDDMRSDDLLNLFYPTQKKKISNFCKMISQYAKNSENSQLKTFCTEILQQQIQYLAEQCFSIYTLLKNDNYDGQIQCFLIGSFWKALEVDTVKQYFKILLDQMKIYDKFEFYQGNESSGCIGTAIHKIQLSKEQYEQICDLTELVEVEI